MDTKIIGDIAVINSKTPIITDTQTALDLIASVGFEYGISKIAINKAAILEDFFRLSTGFAGEITQKFVTYGYRLVIIGDFSGYTSKPLRDYIYECNNGKHLNFVPDEREAVGRLCGKRSEYSKYFHGTKADLSVGDLLLPGYDSNYGQGAQANFVYFSATMDAAVWGAELAQGCGKGRIYIVEPTGAFEDDPNLTDMKYPGNPTLSYRTKEPLKITGEVEQWNGHPQNVLQGMLDGLAKLQEQGIEAINE
jgi:rifampin ADP-ribosylating transferase